MKWLSISSLAALSLGAVFNPSAQSSGCNSSTAPVFTALPQVGLSQKQVVKLNLDDYLSDSDNTNAELTLSVSGADATKVAASIDASSHVLTLTAASSFTGKVSLLVQATDPSGNTGDATLETQVHANRSCSTTISYDSTKYGAVTKLTLAGQFNGWSSTATPMTSDGKGVYSATLTLPAGAYQYKFVDNGTNWFQDPGNPYRAFDGGVENSEFHVGDCTQPLLSLSDLQVNSSTGTIDATVLYTDGSSGLGPDPSSLKVSVSDVLDDPGFSDYDRTFHVHLTGLTAGKHTLRFYASNASGSAADMLFVPAWIETTAFSWSSASLYFAFTDRFSDGNTANNLKITNVPTQSNYQGGDYAGITAKIKAGYFTALGINALWISPQLDNTNNAEYGDDGRLYSGYHGYWPIDSSKAEAGFGSSQELKDLIAAAHEKGIRVLFDLVANHVHNQHPYYQAHANDGWFNPYSLCSQNNGWNVNPIGCWFAPYLPDINYQNSAAMHAMAADAVRVAQDYDIDGYRVDAVKHVEKAYLYHLVADTQEQVEHHFTSSTQQFYLVGETFTGEWTPNCDNTANCSQWLIKSFIGPQLLDGQFDFPVYWTVLKAFARNEATMADLANLVILSDGYYGSSALMAPFLGNHDVARFISHANGDISDQWGSTAKEQGWTNPPKAPTSYVPYQKLELAFTFLATDYGVPLMYYGDEIGMPGAGDPDNRRMMRFGTSLSTFESQALAYNQKVVSLRTAHQSLRANSRVMLLGTDPDVMVYGKVGTSEKAVVALNRSGSSRTVTVNITTLGLSSGQILTDAIGGGTATVSGSTVTITLPAYTAALYF